MLVVDWDMVNNLYKEGMTIKELSDKFDIKKKTIYSNLNKLYPDSKRVHKQIRRELKSREGKESKRHMGDFEVIKRNPSIYSANKGTGDIYLNTHYAIPIDVPRVLKNCRSEVKRKRLNIKKSLRLRSGDVVSLNYLDNELSEISKYRVLDSQNSYNVMNNGYIEHKVLGGNIIVYFDKIDEKTNINKRVKVKKIEFRKRGN
ncbi:hypothetical protein [Clostridium baratii]|uniref:hypothetical protein n=1 Tax=Clostridium baratii TaxID=1561 RepID=UPI0030CB77C9